MNLNTPLKMVFFRTEHGSEPVRKWLQELPREDRKTIGEDIKAVQYGWPIGSPLVRKLAWGINISAVILIAFSKKKAC
jgi:hypothetical protein